jgi:hypothetical protein
MADQMKRETVDYYANLEQLQLELGGKKYKKRFAIVREEYDNSFTRSERV